MMRPQALKIRVYRVDDYDNITQDNAGYYKSCECRRIATKVYSGDLDFEALLVQTVEDVWNDSLLPEFTRVNDHYVEIRDIGDWSAFDDDPQPTFIYQIYITPFRKAD